MAKLCVSPLSSPLMLLDDMLDAFPHTTCCSPLYPITQCWVALALGVQWRDTRPGAPYTIALRPDGFPSGGIGVGVGAGVGVGVGVMVGVGVVVGLWPTTHMLSYCRQCSGPEQSLLVEQVTGLGVGINVNVAGAGAGPL